MSKEQLSVLVIVSGFAIGLVIQLGSYVLDQAAAKQCREHQWPAHLDDTHRDWCIANGYTI